MDGVVGRHYLKDVMHLVVCARCSRRGDVHEMMACIGVVREPKELWEVRTTDNSEYRV